ncbi:MAG: hypothetical protein TREMPRED_004298 [Tremellales sp. Tagirdzhanova-0007]|nr:MAG: hypothetical protein TREMPRED_004298 [Tremellales sp. Tagirdzhanova-0007]
MAWQKVCAVLPPLTTCEVLLEYALLECDHLYCLPIPLVRFFRSAIQQQACRAAIAGQILLSLALPATFLLKNRAVDYPVPLDDDLHNKLGVAGQAMLPLSITNLEELELGCLAVAFEVYNGRFVNANHGLDLKANPPSLPEWMRDVRQFRMDWDTYSSFLTLPFIGRYLSDLETERRLFALDITAEQGLELIARTGREGEPERSPNSLLSEMHSGEVIKCSHVARTVVGYLIRWHFSLLVLHPWTVYALTEKFSGSLPPHVVTMRDKGYATCERVANIVPVIRAIVASGRAPLSTLSLSRSDSVPLSHSLCRSSTLPVDILEKPPKTTAIGQELQLSSFGLARHLLTLIRVVYTFEGTEYPAPVGEDWRILSRFPTSHSRSHAPHSPFRYELFHRPARLICEISEMMHALCGSDTGSELCHRVRQIVDKVCVPILDEKDSGLQAPVGTTATLGGYYHAIPAMPDPMLESKLAPDGSFWDMEFLQDAI